MGLQTCPFCGAHLEGDEKFCPICGKELPARVVSVEEEGAPAKNDNAVKSVKSVAHKKKRKWLFGLLGGVIIIGLVVTALFVFILPKKLSGTYSAEIPLLFRDVTDTLTFSEGKVAETFDGQKMSKGSYTISGDKLTLIIGKSTLTAKLAKDKKSFAIQTAGGETGLTEGLTFTLGAKKVVKKTDAGAEKALAASTDTQTVQTIKRKLMGTYTVKSHKVAIATGRHVVNVELSEADDKTFEIKQADLDAWLGKTESDGAVADAKAATSSSATTTSSSSATATTSSTAAKDSPSDDKKRKGTYSISGNILTAEVGRYKATITLAADHKTFELTSTEIKPELKKMDFDQIAKGDYTSLLGEWKLAGMGARHYTLDGPPLKWSKDDGSGDNSLTVTTDKLATDFVSLQRSTLTAGNQESTLGFKVDDDALVATIVEGESAINWAVMFYPGGVSSGLGMLLTDGVTVDESKNRIVFWSSNNNNYLVYEQKGPDLSTQWNGEPLNLDDIRFNNFLSLVGTWVNPKTSKKIVVTSKVMGDPYPDINTISSNGAILAEPLENGYPKVIAPLTGDYAGGDDYITAGMNSYDPTKDDAGVQYYMAEIIPAGVEREVVGLGTGDSSKDRIVYLGNSFTGTEYDVYYRESELPE